MGATWVVRWAAKKVADWAARWALQLAASSVASLVAQKGYLLKVSMWAESSVECWAAGKAENLVYPTV